MKTTKTNKTEITFSKKDFQEYLSEQGLFPKGDLKIKFKTKVVDDKSNPGRHDIRDPWPKKSVVNEIIVTIEHND